MTTIPRRTLLSVVSLCLLALALPAVADAAKRKPAKLTVMTRNLYLGADLIPIAAAQNEADVEKAVTKAWNNVRSTDFPARAKRIAQEVKRYKPDLIALQEGAIWRRGPKGDSAPAQDVQYDYIKTLRSELKKLGLKYRLGKVQSEFDYEAPSDLGYDYRLTQQDAVLIRKRKGLKVRSLDSGQFKARFDLPTFVGTAKVFRGWTLANLSFNGRRFRFVDSHLEAYSEAIGTAQANELFAKGGPARSKRPVILAGDMNSDPVGVPPNGPGPYNALTGFGFIDTWKRANKGDKGFTCCEKEDLKNPTSPFDRRIDYVFARKIRKVLSSKLFGYKPSERTGSGLWPSDHGGVVSRLQLK